MNEANFQYQGEELESFAQAHNWKSYVSRKLAPFITGNVFEVGAGLGETAKALKPGSAATSWTCIEPDAAMAGVIQDRVLAGELGSNIRVHAGLLAQAPQDGPIDTIIYIDVLEHIEDDSRELETAADLIGPGGRIVVLSPAYQFLFSPFDTAVGHFRRYTKRALRSIAPTDLVEEAAFYLDCVGLAASAANRMLLKQSLPTIRQIQTWDRLMVPVSRVLDPVVMHALGRSIVLVWRKP